MKDKILAEKSGIKFISRTGENGRSHAIIKLPLGGMIMPYFLGPLNEYHLVLIWQYRLSFRKNIMEAVGGRFDGQPAKTALRRELKEETGIEVRTQDIKIVAKEYLHPPLFNGFFIGAIVKIDSTMVENNRMAGNEQENESTQVETWNLPDILRLRDNDSIKLDIMTSRLIDEVAKETGLLQRNY